VRAKRRIRVLELSQEIGAKERRNHPCRTKKAFATHESSLGSKKKSNSKEVVSDLGSIDFASQRWLHRLARPH
jgi:hypothetical protein